jgi:hypothetical protein
VAVLGAGGAIWASMRSAVPAPVVQPMAFSHKVHAEQDLACKDCHS